MKILFNCLSQAWGGRETSFFDDVVQFKKKGFDVVGLVIKDSILQKKFEMLFPDIHIEKIDKPTFKYFNPLLLHTYYTLIKKSKPHIIHSHDTWSLYTLLVVLRFFSKIPIVATQHLFIRHKKKGFYRKFLYKRLNAMIAISNTMVENVLEMYPLNQKQVLAVYGGFVYSYINPKSKEAFSRKRFNIQDNAFVIGTLGRIDPNKGQLDLLKAFQILRKKNLSRPIHLLITGSPTMHSKESGVYKNEIDKFIIENSLNYHVTCISHIENVPPFMSLLDLFVMPSKFEAFGLVLLQAMSCGLPVIATDAGSTREIIDVGKNGYVYPSGDINALSETLETIITSNNIDSFKKHSLEKYDQVFKYENHIKNLINLYETKIDELKR